MSMIHDQKSLKLWLDTRPVEDATIIAHRAAMRALPAWCAAIADDWARERGLTALPVLRANLASGAARTYRTSVVIATVNARAARSINQTTAAILAAGAVIPTSADISAGAAYAAAKAAEGSFAATDASADKRIAIEMRIRSSVANFASTTVRPTAAALTNMWEMIDTDAEKLISGADPLEDPLWHGSENPLADMWMESLPILRNTPGGEFWIDWYQRALDGQPQNWPMLRDIALIEDDLWQQGGNALDRRITEIRIDHGIKATPNGERIEPHPESGLLQLIPGTELPDDMAGYIRRKIVNIVGIFDDVPQGNQYYALQPDLQMLRRAAENTDNSPVELYDACKSALGRLAIHIQTGNCPPAEQDAIIADYQSRLLDTAADIIGNDPKTQDVLESRNRITGNNALVDNRNAVLAGVEKLTEITTDDFAEKLVSDVNTATSTEATPEERKAASYRFVSRGLRIVGWVTGGSPATPPACAKASR